MCPLSLFDVPGCSRGSFCYLGGVVRDQFEFISGEKHLTWYESSETAFRGYCSRCGSPLVFQSSRWEDEIHVTLASFVNTIDRSPAATFFLTTTSIGCDSEMILGAFRNCRNLRMNKLIVYHYPNFRAKSSVPC